MDKINDLTLEENLRRRDNGLMYFPWARDQIQDRRKCRQLCQEYNDARMVGRRKLVQMLQEIIRDDTPLPPPAATPPQEVAQLKDFLWVDAPIMMDFGYNCKFGKNVGINYNSFWLDTCPITVGDRTMIGPNCSFYAATHPTCPIARNGSEGPEGGAPITIGNDCWIGGNVVVLAGVTIGDGCVIGAGSVVHKDIPELSIAVGNPCKVVKKVTRTSANILPPGYEPYESTENPKFEYYKSKM